MFGCTCSSVLVLVCGFFSRLEEMMGLSSAAEDFPANEQSLLAEMSGATSNFPGTWLMSSCTYTCTCTVLHTYVYSINEHKPSQAQDHDYIGLQLSFESLIDRNIGFTVQLSYSMNDLCLYFKCVHTHTYHSVGKYGSTLLNVLHFFVVNVT